MNKAIETWGKKLYTRIIVHEEWRGYEYSQVHEKRNAFSLSLKLAESLKKQMDL
jgi:hypothetical protein